MKSLNERLAALRGLFHRSLISIVESGLVVYSILSIIIIAESSLVVYFTSLSMIIIAEPNLY
jgi:hypothetical protein